MEKNPNNPSHSRPSQPIQPLSSPPPPPPPPQNLTGPSGSNQVYVSNGIPPPPNSSSSNNSLRKPRGRKPKSQDKNILPLPENTRLSAPPAQRPLLLQPPLPHPMQQRDWAHTQLVSPGQQNKQLQAQMSQPMQHTQWVRAQLVPPLQQNQGRQAQFHQPTAQNQWAKGYHQHSPPQKMQRVSYYSELVAEVMHYQWERPQNNSIEFWSQYVAKYYDPKARERWCLSKCKDIMIPTRKDGKSCMLCGWMPQKGYEVSFEELPGRLKTKFDRMMGDRLSPGKAQEHKSKNGVTIVLYPNATHQCMYALECVIYTGLLRLVITDQRKILEWEFCVSDRKTYFKIRRPLSSCSDNLLGIGEILRRPEAKNISDESTEENLQRNSQMEQAVQPRADTNVSRSTGIMQQANSLEHQIKQTTMNVSRATLSSPTSHDGCNQLNADRMSRKRPVSVNANSSETSGWSYEYMVTCLLTNASANLEQEISQNAMSNLQARHPDDSSSQMIVGGETPYKVSGDGATGSTKMAQAAAASPVESREAGLIPDPAMEAQAQDIPVMENPASTDPSPTNQNTTNSQRVMDDLQMFIQKLNDDEFEMLNNFKSDDYDRTEATPLENELDRETYLVESTPCPQA